MDIKEEKEYLQSKVVELENEIKKNKREQSSCNSDIIHWGYTAKIQQLESSLINFKRWLHFAQVKEALDNYLSDDNFGQKHTKELVFEIIDSYGRILDKKNEYGDGLE